MIGPPRHAAITFYLGQNGWCLSWVAFDIYTCVRAECTQPMSHGGDRCHPAWGHMWQWYGSKDKDRVGSVITVSDPRSMNWWALIIALTFWSSVASKIRKGVTID